MPVNISITPNTIALCRQLEHTPGDLFGDYHCRDQLNTTVETGTKMCKSLKFDSHGKPSRHGGLPLPTSFSAALTSTCELLANSCFTPRKPRKFYQIGSSQRPGALIKSLSKCCRNTSRMSSIALRVRSCGVLTSPM